MVRDGFGGEEGLSGGTGMGGAGGEDDGWLRTGGMDKSQEAKVGDVRTLGEGGEVGERDDEEEEEIPDMEDEEDDEEAIIRERRREGGSA